MMILIILWRNGVILEAHLNHDLANHEQHHSTHPSTEN